MIHTATPVCPCCMCTDFVQRMHDVALLCPTLHIHTCCRHDRTLQVEVSYEDQPNNDFRSLFYHTQGIRALPGNPPALAQQPGVFITASGTSFFQQCFPSASVHFGMSFTAMHWLSRQPGPLEGGIHMTQLQDPQQRAAWAAQAAADWQAILLNR